MERPLKKQKVSNFESDEEVVFSEDEEVFLSEDEVVEEETSKTNDNINEQWLIKLSKSIKESLSQNKKQREKFPTEPLKFLDSETELNTHLKELTNITQSSKPLFNKLIELLGEELLSLLSHENYDIIEITLKFFYDLIDVEYEEDQAEFISWLKQADFLVLLLDSLKRAEKTDDVIQLQIIDSLLDYEDETLKKWILFDSKFLKNYIQAIKTSEQDEVYMDILYKLISIDANGVLEKYNEIVEVLLHQLNAVKDLDDDDYVDAVVLNIKVLLSQKSGVKLFLQNEGVELLETLISERVQFLKVFVNLLNLVLESDDDASNIHISKQVISSSKFLKHAFKTLAKLSEVDEVYQYVKFINKLLELLPFESEERLRLINKLIQKEYKNLKLLNKIEQKYSKKIDHDFDYNDEDYSERLWEGLNVVQQINILKAWLLKEDESIKTQLITNKIVNTDTLKEVVTGYEQELVMNLELLKEGSIESDSELADSLNTQLETLKELTNDI